MPPLLFNLVADALSAMLSRAKNAGITQGLVLNLVDGGLTHLQYVDDTVLLLKFNTVNLRNVRLILSCYEAMSGMKINFDKSEVFTMGLTEAEQQTVIASLSCKLGAFPMKYLGMPVSDGKISKAHLRYVSDKLRRD